MAAPGSLAVQVAGRSYGWIITADWNQLSIKQLRLQLEKECGEGLGWGSDLAHLSSSTCVDLYRPSKALAGAVHWVARLWLKQRTLGTDI